MLIDLLVLVRHHLNLNQKRGKMCGWCFQQKTDCRCLYADFGLTIRAKMLCKTLTNESLKNRRMTMNTGILLYTGSNIQYNKYK